MSVREQCHKELDRFDEAVLPAVLVFFHQLEPVGNKQSLLGGDRIHFVDRSNELIKPTGPMPDISEFTPCIDTENWKFDREEANER